MFSEIISKAVGMAENSIIHIPSLKKLIAEKMIEILELGKGKGDSYLDEKIAEVKAFGGML